MNKEKLLLCPKCENFPLLSLNKEKPKNILILCDHCGYQSEKFISDYLKENEPKEKQANNNKSNLCKEHRQLILNYCVDCKLYICDKCNLHKLHHLINPSDILSVNLLNSKIKQGNCLLKNYCSQLKTSKINELIKQINQIEYAYQSFFSINNDILTFIQLVVKNYTNNKYNSTLKCNMMNIPDICISKCYNNAINGIIDYYNNYTFLQYYLPINLTTIKKSKIIRGHGLGVSCLLLLSDGRLASCSRDKTIRVYDIENDYHCDINIQAHTDSVNYIIEFEKDKLLTCSGDLSLKIWKISKLSLQCEYTIEKAHLNWIMKVISLSNYMVASCSYDKTIKIWNSFYPFGLIQVLEGHTNYISSIIQLKDKKYLISGSGDGDMTLRKWSLSTFQCETILNNIHCFDSNSIIEIDNNRLIITGKKNITIVNATKFIIEKSIESDRTQSIYTVIPLRDGNILCGCEGGFFFIFDIELNTITYKEIRGHNDSIYDFVKINNRTLVSCSEDSTIIVWKF